MLDKPNSNHKCSDREVNDNQSDRIDSKKEYNLLKQESKLSHDNVIDQLPKGYLESKANEIMKEVCSWWFTDLCNINNAMFFMRTESAK